MQEEFEDNTGVIKIRKAKMDRQHYGQEKKRRTDNTMDKRKREGQTIPWPREKEATMDTRHRKIDTGNIGHKTQKDRHG